jgi:hypothetical protein
MSKEIVACCGLICSECNAYKASRNNDLQLAEKTAAEWSAQFHVEVKVEDIWCDGCTAAGRKCAHCSECEIRDCAMKRSVANCSGCVDYPCKTIEGFLAMVPAAKVKLDSLRAT